MALLEYLRRLRSAHEESLTLDGLIAHADPQERLETRLLFLVRLVRWIRQSVLIVADDGKAPVAITEAQPTRLRFLLDQLDKNPQWRLRVASTLRSVLRDTSSIELFSETGLPAQLDLLGELYDRLARHLTPAALDLDDLGELFEVLFPSKRDADWIERVDDASVHRFMALFSEGETASEGDWNSIAHDLENAFVVLVSEVRTTGMSKSMRTRMRVPFKRLPFVNLARSADELNLALAVGDEADIQKKKRGFLARVGGAEVAVAVARANLVGTGVTMPITYQMTRLDAQLRRIRDLVDLMTGARETGAIQKFLAALVRETHERSSVRALLRQTSELWSRKVVERSAETGEHYIARSRSEWRQMLRMAAIGGALTGVTVIVKLLVGSLHLPPLYEGIAFAANYSASFLLIHALHGTLATKQPANTAPAMAAKLSDASTEEGAEAFVDEVTHLIRTQVAGILGNVLCVIPATLLLDLGLRLSMGHAPVPLEKAEKTLHSLSLLGPSFAFAGFTGILLWIGGFIGGAVDNWIAFKHVKSIVGTSVLFTIAFGRARARRIGSFVARNLPAIASNVALGSLLGLTPVLMVALNLPIDVRHVTLASGSLAESVATLGIATFRQADFWWAFAGIWAIGAFNLGISFTIAMRVALAARSVHGATASLIRRALWRRIRRKPLTFLLPIGLPQAPAHVPRPSQVSLLDLPEM
jgi:site-specific recombinase